ncbi:MAG: NirA family protein [Verrucomicrobiales bacterium]|nr:NirA family protein [Verrucomicrobiales bacterium]
MLTEISGQKLTTEQTAYLDGLFAGLRNRGLSFGDVEPNPAAAPRPAPAADLIPEERIKRDLHPLDAYPLLLQHAAANQAPDRENTFRFKWQGLFYLTPNREAYMARLRIPGGRLYSFQLRALADIADKLTTGYLQITTRANLQMRLIEPKDTVEFVRRIQGIGLHTRGSGADNIRNLTCDPTSGVDPDELIETLPLVEALGQLILNHREFYDLPRKFNIAFHGGGAIPTVEDTNDIGFKAVRVGAEAPPDGTASSHGVLVTDRVAGGTYFRCALGGATGHKAFARDLGVLLRPEEILEVTAALLRVYIANGNRGDRKRARLKHLLEHWSLDQYRTETERLLGRSLLQIPSDARWIPASTPAQPHPQVGIRAQRQAGFFWIGARVPVGQVTSRQLRRLAEIADLYGSGEVRLTVWQNVVLPNVPEAFVETARKALARIGFETRQSNVASGVIACTGSSYCKFASADTKGHALELMRWLERRVELDQPINIHLTGCPNSCAQHYMGDLGLLGTKVKVGGESVPGYHVFVGGGFGDRQAVGRQLFTGVSASQLNATMERILKNFLRHREPGETFQAFTTRHDLRRLQELLGDET